VVAMDSYAHRPPCSRSSSSSSSADEDISNSSGGNRIYLGYLGAKPVPCLSLSLVQRYWYVQIKESPPACNCYWTEEY
jgi:hypothetical protein